MPTALFYRLWFRSRLDPSTPVFWDLHGIHKIRGVLYHSRDKDGQWPVSSLTKSPLGTGQCSARSPPMRSCAKADGFREWVSLAAAGYAHLEPGVGVTLPDLLQQLPAGLPHQASSLQEILARLQGTRQNQHQAREQALKPHSGSPLASPFLSVPQPVQHPTSALAGCAVFSRSETALARFLAACRSCRPFPPSSSISAASSFTPLDISVRLEEMVVTAQPTAV